MTRRDPTVTTPDATAALQAITDHLADALATTGPLQIVPAAELRLGDLLPDDGEIITEVRGGPGPLPWDGWDGKNEPEVTFTTMRCNTRQRAATDPVLVCRPDRPGEPQDRCGCSLLRHCDDPDCFYLHDDLPHEIAGALAVAATDLLTVLTGPAGPGESPTLAALRAHADVLRTALAPSALEALLARLGPGTVFAYTRAGELHPGDLMVFGGHIAAVEAAEDECVVVTTRTGNRTTWPAASVHPIISPGSPELPCPACGQTVLAGCTDGCTERRLDIATLRRALSDAGILLTDTRPTTKESADAPR